MRRGHPRRELDGALSKLDDAIELLHRADSAMANRLRAMSDAMQGHPPSPNLDPSTRMGAAHWCWTHEQVVPACHAEGLSCSGEALSGPSDPVGAAAERRAMRRDRAYDDREAFIRSCNALHSEAGRLVSILERYGTRPATLQERRETSTANKDDCRSCARQEVSAGVRRGEPGFYNPMVGGERMRLCEWCYDWHRAVGRLPSLSELSDHHRGVQVRRPKVAS